MLLELLERTPERGAWSGYRNWLAPAVMALGWLTWAAPPAHAQCTSDSQCNDGIACTRDECFGAPSGFCVNADNCPDSLICNGTETCCTTVGGCSGTPRGSCRAGTPVTCSPGYVCSEAHGGCVRCTTNAHCNDGNSCTTDVCTAENLCQNTFTPGASCSDGDLCTVGDTCQTVGSQQVCVGTPRDCTAEAPVCHFGTCSQSNGQCQFFPRSNGTACQPSPPDYCHAAYWCQSGQCVGKPPDGCVNLELRLVGGQTTYNVGDVINVQLWATASGCPAPPTGSPCPSGAQEVNAIEAVFNYNSTYLKLANPTEIGEPNPQDPCDDANSCNYTCSSTTRYNWGSSVFPSDCNPGARINAPCTGFPGHDNDFFYACLQQLTCNGQPANPACARTGGLWVTTFKLKAIKPTAGVSGPATIGLASCITTPYGQTRTKVVSAVVAGDDVTKNLAAPLSLTIKCVNGSDCPFGVCTNGSCVSCLAPAGVVEGSRYIGVTPAAGPPQCALWVQGSSPEVACRSGYVQSDGRLGATPLYRSPAEWGSVHVRGDNIIGGKAYNVYTDCNPSSPGTSRSVPVAATVWRAGDTDGNNAVDVVDAVKCLDCFRNVFHQVSCTSDADCTNVRPYRKCDLGVGKCLWITLENVDLTGDTTCVPNRACSLRDVVVVLDQFRQLPDSCLDAVRCP